MNLSKDQIEQIESQLSLPWGRVEMKIDGHDITCAVESNGPLRQVISVYVDGCIKGEYMNEESEIGKKFYTPSSRFLYSEKDREGLLKLSKKRIFSADVRKRYSNMASAKSTIHRPYFTNAKLLLRKFKKTCADVAVVKIGRE